VIHINNSLTKVSEREADLKQFNIFRRMRKTRKLERFDKAEPYSIVRVDGACQDKM